MFGIWNLIIGICRRKATDSWTRITKTRLKLGKMSLYRNLTVVQEY